MVCNSQLPTPNSQLPTPNSQLPRPNVSSRRNGCWRLRDWTWGLGVGSWVLMTALAIACAGCGKKGSPLAPIIHVPAAVQTISTRRLGSDVFVTLTVPAQNIDTSTPADVRRVDLFGYTGMTPPPRGRFLDGAVLVATIPVAPPLLPDGSAVPP